MAKYLPTTLESLVRSGANVTIEDVGYTPQTLVRLMELAVSSGAHITLSGHYLPQTLEQLAQIGRNQLTIIVR